MIFDKIQLVEELINISIEEDLKDGDPSSEIIYSNPQAKYNLILKEDAVISGIEVFKYIFNKIDKSINFMNFKEDSFYYKGVIGEIIGNESQERIGIIIKDKDYELVKKLLIEKELQYLRLEKLQLTKNLE